MVLLELSGCTNSGLVDSRAKCFELTGALLKCDGARRDEVGSGKNGVGGRNEVRCFCDVEGENWVGTSDCEVRGATHAFANRDALRPKDRVRDLRPFANVAIGSFVQCLSDVVVGSFNDSIRARIVATDANVIDLVLFL